MHTVTPGGKVTNRPSTTDDLAEIRARVNAANEEPWWRHDDLDDMSRLLDAVEAVLKVLDGQRTIVCLDCMHPDCMLEADIRWAIRSALGASE